MVLAEKSQESNWELYIQRQSQPSTIILTQSRSSRAAAAAAAALGMSFRVCQLPRPNEALDRIQNKELFIIIYTKLVH